MLDGGWGKRDGGHLSKFGAALVNEAGRPDHRVGRKVGRSDMSSLRKRRIRAGRVCDRCVTQCDKGQAGAVQVQSCSCNFNTQSGTVRGIGVAGYEAQCRVVIAHPHGAARGPLRKHSSPCLPSPLQTLTSSQDASSSAINAPHHLSLSSLFQAQLYSGFTAFLQTPFSNYANISTAHILSSALENSFTTTFTNSRWTESHGQIQSQCARKRSSSKSSIFSTALATIFSPPWTMVVSRMTVSSWRFPAHHRPNHPSRGRHLSLAPPPLLPSTV